MIDMSHYSPSERACTARRLRGAAASARATAKDRIAEGEPEEAKAYEREAAKLEEKAAAYEAGPAGTATPTTAPSAPKAPAPADAMAEHRRGIRIPRNITTAVTKALQERINQENAS